MNAAIPIKSDLPDADRITICNLDSLLDQIANPLLMAQGCVNMVSIAPVRDKLGDRWERSRENIYDRVKKLLDRQLSTTDYECRISETDYLLSLPGDSRQSAQMRCMRILQELLELFLGQWTIEQMDIRTVTERQGDTLIAEAVDVATLHRISDASFPPPAPNTQNGPSDHDAPPAKVEPILVGNRTLYLDFEFRPIWDLRHNAISSFSLNVIPKTDQSRLLGEARADRSQLNMNELTAIDLISAKYGLETLLYLFRRQNRFILHLPCSYETLASSRARPQFLDAIKSFAPELRRYITFELYDLPSGVPQSRLSALVTMINPFGRGVIASVRAQRTGAHSLQGCGLLGTAVELESAGLPENEIFMRVNTFRERAHLAGEQMIAYGVATRSLVLACWSMGLSHVSGDAIAPACAIPYQMSRFRPLDLYQH